MSAWPDPERPGVPPNPEKTQRHWLASDANCLPYLFFWRAKRGCWEPTEAGWIDRIAPADLAEWRYLGPCLTPSEVAAAVAQAVKQEREAIAAICDARARAVPTIGDDWGHGPEEAKRLAGLIRARSKGGDHE